MLFKKLKFLIVFLLIFSWLLSGYPRIWKNPPIPPEVKEVKAASTRLYIQNASAGYTPSTIRGAWDTTSGAVVAKLDTAKGGSSTSKGIAETSATLNYDVLLARFVSEPLLSDTSFTTSDTVQWMMAVLESNASANDFYHIHIFVTQGDSDNLRGTLLTDSIGATEWPTTATGRGEGTKALSNVNALAGDRIVVEVGYQAQNNKTTSYTGTLYYGGTDATDLTSGDTNTAHPGWIEFSNNFSLKHTTTLGNGTDPSNSTNGPGTTNYLDQFSFVTDSGTDTVTGLTVTTTNTSAIASMKICSNDDSCTTQYFNTVTSPSGDNWSFSGGTSIPVTTTTSYYRVVITAKDHSSLAEGTYAITGYVSAFTCTNTQAGSDSAGTTITIDNAPPSNATWGTITPGDQQVELNWSNPESDFYKVLILRKASSSVTDAPTDGTEYSAPGTIGDSTIIYVGNGTSFTDTGLTNGTDYYYKIFAYDQYKNYASGAGTGPHQPFAPSISITVSDGTVEYGIVPKNTAKTTLSSDMPPSGDMQTVSYDTNVTVNINIKGNNASGGGCTWTLASSSGSDQYVHQFCNATDNNCSSPPTNYTALTTNYQTLKSGVSGQGSVNFHLRLITPTESSCYGQQSVNVDVQAVQP